MISLDSLQTWMSLPLVQVSVAFDKILKDLGRARTVFEVH
jgi:hypothetical protein